MRTALRYQADSNPATSGQLIRLHSAIDFGNMRTAIRKYADKKRLHPDSDSDSMRTANPTAYGQAFRRHADYLIA
jgi:hypothetical protein